MNKLKSLKGSCIISIGSAFLGWLSISIAFRNITACIDCIMWLPILFGILSLVFIVLWFVSLFFAVRHLTNSSKWGIISMLLIVALLGVFLIQYVFMHPGTVSLIRMYEKFSAIMFLVFFVISIILLVAFFVRSHKEAKKSS